MIKAIALKAILAVLKPQGYPHPLSLYSNFFASPQGGQKCEIKVEIQKKGRSICFAEAKLYIPSKKQPGTMDVAFCAQGSFGTLTVGDMDTWGPLAEADPADLTKGPAADLLEETAGRSVLQVGSAEDSLLLYVNLISPCRQTPTIPDRNRQTSVRMHERLRPHSRGLVRAFQRQPAHVG